MFNVTWHYYIWDMHELGIWIFADMFNIQNKVILLPFIYNILNHSRGLLSYNHIFSQSNVRTYNEIYLMIQNKIIQSQPSKGIYLQIHPFAFVLASFLEMTKF